MYADGFDNSMIDDKDGHILLQLIMFPCTALCHALLEWPKNKGVHPTVSKSKMRADTPDRSNYCNNRNQCGKNASWCAAAGRKLLTLPTVGDTYILDEYLEHTTRELPPEGI